MAEVATIANLRDLMEVADHRPDASAEAWNARRDAEHVLRAWRLWLPGLLDLVAPEAAPMREDVTQASIESAFAKDEAGFSDADCAVVLIDRYARDAKRDGLPQTAIALSRAAEIIRLAATRLAHTARPDAEDDYVLPCDVHLPPAIVIRAGCPISTLKLAMEADYRPRHFHGNPRYSIPTDAGDEVERVARILAGLELTDDGYSLRNKFDGDADDQGRSVVVGGDVVLTFADSDDGEELREAILALAAMREGVDR